MLEFINSRSHDKLTDEEIEALNEDVRTSSRSKITCREFKKSATLKECCVHEDCRLSDGSNGADPVAKRAADVIMARGDVLKFLVNQAQKNHKGDTDIIKHLLASVASSCSLTSAGIQPELNGAKGHGKTDAVRAVFHLIPDRWKLAASISAKALYYHKDLPAGAVVFSDDVQWSDDLISTVKRSMGSFQEPQVHFTLDQQRNPLPHTMPPRLVWWLSSVESVANDQLKDRQYSLDIDEGRDHSVEVSDYLRVSRSKKCVRFSVDQGVETARAIIEKIKSHEPFKVVIDCAEFAYWKIKEDHRTQNKFWDLVEAFAILRYEQRVIDEDGWLHATVEDFNEAKTIFMRRKANHRTHLTNAQTKVVKSIIALQNNSDGATRATIAKDLGISMEAVRKSLDAIEHNTQFVVHEKGRNGERFYQSTVIGLEVCYAEGDIVSLPDDYQDPNNSLQLGNNYETTKKTTIEIDSNIHNYITKQPNPKECSNVDSGLVSNEENPEIIAIPAKRVVSVVSGRPVANDQVVSMVVSVVPGCLDLTILRFLGPVPAFVGTDSKTYGPFSPEDVATVPSLNAKGLIFKELAAQIIPEGAKT
jgi:hypothetical protein